MKTESTLENTKFLVGGGTYIYSDKIITFSLNVQGNLFEITAHIISSLGGLDLIVGTREMAALEASLNFKNNILKFKSKAVLAKLTRNTILKPGETRILAIKAKLPDVIKNAEVYLKPTKFLSKLLPTLMIIKMHKGISKIAIYNHTSKLLRLKCEKPIGSILLSNFGQIPVQTNYNDLASLVQAIGKTPSPSSKYHTVPYNVYTAVQGENCPGHVLSSPTDKTDAATAADVDQLVSETPNGNAINIDRQALYKYKINKYPFLDADDIRLKMTDDEILKKDLVLKDHCMGRTTLEKFWNILFNNKKSFSLHGEPGDCPNLDVKFELNDATPFYIRPYPVSESDKDIIDKEMNKLIKMGILDYGKGSYVSPILLLKKKDNPSNPYRIVSDLRVLNLRIAPIHYCTPLLRDALQIIGRSEANIFSSIDIKNAFYSLNVHPDSRKYLTIAPYAAGRTLQYKKMPQGLCISPSEWNDKIADILSQIPRYNDFCVCIADDILVFSKSAEEHLTHLDKLLQVLGKEGLKISVGKCQFFKKSLKYMGHNIQVYKNRPAIKPQKDKVEAINKLSVPKTPRQLKGFIGMCAYLSMYVPRLQLLLTPMHRLTRKNTPYVWTKECQENFEEIKSLLVQAPVLALPSKEGLFRLYCDSSRVGTGGCLVQVQDGEERILSFYSKKFTESAKNYSVSELEGTGILTCIAAYKYLLRNVPFEVIVDHSALVQIASSKREPPTLRLKKILEKLSDFKFIIKYKKGKEMVISDYFSRYPTSEADDTDPIAFLHKELYDRCYPSDRHEVSSTCQMGIKHQMPEVCNICMPVHCQCKGSTDGRYESSADSLLMPVTTRASARASGAEVLPGLPAPTRAKRRSSHAEDLPTERSTDHSSPGVPPNSEKNVATDDVIIESSSTIGLPSPLQQPLQDCNEGLEAEQQLQSTRKYINEPMVDRTSSHKPHHSRLVDLVRDKPLQTHFRNVVRQPERTLEESHTLPEEWMYETPKQVFEPNSDINIFHKNIPKQADIEKMQKSISKRIITDSYLPASKAVLAREQATDPYFKPIYNWLRYGHLPSNSRQQRKLKIIAEDFVLADDILYKLELNEKDKHLKPFKVSICIPQNMEKMIFHMEHDGLMSNHLGVTKTYLTIKERYYIRGLFNKILNFIRSCYQCQSFKRPKDIERPFEIRVPANFKPFDVVYGDIKYVFPSSSGNQYLLVLTCEITRYCELIPLRKMDGPSVAEALLRRLILRYGTPRLIIFDAAASFFNEVTEFLYKAVNTTVKFISPHNHGSNVAERTIGSISNLLLSNLKGTGRNWDLFIESVMYAHNTHVIPSLGFLPFFLLYLRDPVALGDLRYTPLEDIKYSYREYVEFLKQRLQQIGKTMIDIQFKLQTSQAERQLEKVRNINKYKEGLIVFCLCPSASSLNTKSLKFKSQYLGPLVISQMLSSDKVTLQDLSGRPLHGIYHVNRLKPGYFRTNKGCVSTIQELRKEFTKAQIEILQRTPDVDLDTINQVPIEKTEVKTVDDHMYTISECINEPGYCNKTDIFFVISDVPDNEVNMKLYNKYVSCNNNIASNKPLTDSQINNIIKNSDKTPPTGSEMEVTKLRFKEGHLELLVSTTELPSKFSTWIQPRLHPNICPMVCQFLEANPKMRISGSPKKLVRKLFP